MLAELLESSHILPAVATEKLYHVHEYMVNLHHLFHRQKISRCAQNQLAFMVLVGILIGGSYMRIISLPHWRIIHLIISLSHHLQFLTRNMTQWSRRLYNPEITLCRRKTYIAEMKPSTVQYITALKVYIQKSIIALTLKLKLHSIGAKEAKVCTNQRLKRLGNSQIVGNQERKNL